MGQADANQTQLAALRRNIKNASIVRKGRIHHTASTLLQPTHILKSSSKQVGLPHCWPGRCCTPFAMSLTLSAKAAANSKEDIQDMAGLLAVKRRLLAPVQASLRKRLKHAHAEQAYGPISEVFELCTCVTTILSGLDMF